MTFVKDCNEHALVIYAAAPAPRANAIYMIYMASAKKGGGTSIMNALKEDCLRLCAASARGS